MKRFRDDTQKIIDDYINKLCDFAEDYVHNGRFLEPWDKDLQKIMEDYAMDIIKITCGRMIDPD